MRLPGRSAILRWPPAENVLLDPVTPGLVASWAAQFPALHDELAALPVSSGMIVPLRSGARTVGLVFVASLQPAWRFTRDDLSLMREVADRVSQALENARLFASAQLAQAKAEAAARDLAAAEQRFRSAFANAPIGMALLSTRPGESNHIDDVNPALCKLTGFAPDELQGSDLDRDACPPVRARSRSSRCPVAARRRPERDNRRTPLRSQ